jgi:hypothetical protein
MTDALRQALIALINDNTPKQVSICQVIAVDEAKNTCRVKDLVNDIELVNVRLSAGKTSKQTLLVPAVNSIVLVALIGNSKQERYVSMVSECSKVIINGTTNGGLVKAEELTSQLDKVTARIDAIASVLTTGSNSGGPVVFAGMSSPDYTNAMANKENFNSIQNTNVLH